MPRNIWIDYIPIPKRNQSPDTRQNYTENRFLIILVIYPGPNQNSAGNVEQSYD